MTKKSRSSLSRGEKFLFFGMPVLLVLGVGTTVVFSRINSRVEIKYPSSSPMPNPNGFDLYVSASKAITAAKPPVDPINELKRSRAPQGSPQYSLARREAWLKANSAGFTLFRQAQKAESRHPIDAQPLGNRNYGKLRALARYKIIEANTLEMRRDWNGATNSALDILEMSADISAQAPLLGKLTAVGIEGLAKGVLNTPDDLIDKLNLAQTQSAAKRLEAILNRRESYVQALECERWDRLRLFEWFRTQPNWRKELWGQKEWKLGERFNAFLMPESQIVDQLNQIYDESLAANKMPLSAKGKKRTRRSSLVNFFAYAQDLRQHEARSTVPLRVLLLRFALHAYRLDNGHYPQNLNQLAPKYLNKVPTDIYADDAPFHYINKGQTYLLYSVGPNLKDDGGIPLTWSNGRKGVWEGKLPPLSPLPYADGDYVAGAND